MCIEFLQVSYVKCSTGKGSCYRRVKLVGPQQNSWTTAE